MQLALPLAEFKAPHGEFENAPSLRGHPSSLTAPAAAARVHKPDQGHAVPAVSLSQAADAGPLWLLQAQNAAHSVLITDLSEHLWLLGVDQGEA